MTPPDNGEYHDGIMQLLAEEGKAIDDRVEKEAERWEPEPAWKTHYRVTMEDGR